MRVKSGFLAGHWRMAMLVGAVMLGAGGSIIWRSRAADSPGPSGAGVTVVAAASAAKDRRVPPDAAAGPTPATLDGAAANQLVTRTLPALREVRSACDAAVCTLSAIPRAAGRPLDEQAFSQLVQEDMPMILARTGHGLLEPIQIEELGPDQYRLRFRIPRAAR